jgi:hypothetical protein
MKGITTIAALPNGAGQAAHLPAEVGEAREYASGGPVAEGSTLRVHEGTEAFTPFSTVSPLILEAAPVAVHEGVAKARAVEESGLVTLHVQGCWGIGPGALFTLNGVGYYCASVEAHPHGGFEIGCYREVTL